MNHSVPNRARQPSIDRRGFVSVGRYITTAGVGEPFEVGQHQAVQRLAQDIVSTMQADW